MQTNRILILYDNRTADDDLTPGWGFSALVELEGKQVLFDAGADFLVLKRNAEGLGVNLEATDMLFLSHDHCDHIGGVPAVRRKGIEVYYPASFRATFGQQMDYAQAVPKPLSHAAELSAGLYSTGELGGEVLGTRVKEQALVIKSRKGSVLVTGCAHPGIVNMARAATGIVGDSIQLLVGGFHLMLENEHDVEAIASELGDLGVREIAPCHCTGRKGMGILRQAFGDAYTDIMLGSEILL